MLVKCRSCGLKIERNDAYKVVIDGKNIYYCNEGEYKKIVKEKEEKDGTYKLIWDIFGYKVTNTALFKEINELLHAYSYTVIFAYLQDNKTHIEDTLRRKDFVSEYAKIRYFSAILKNTLADFKLSEPEPIREVEVDMPESKYKRKNKRKGLYEIEMEVGDEL